MGHLTLKNTWAFAAATVAVACGVLASTGTAYAHDGWGGPNSAPHGRYIYSFKSGVLPGAPTNGRGETVYNTDTGLWDTHVVTNGLVPGASYTIVGSDLDGSHATDICTYNDDPTGSGGCERNSHELAAFQKVVSRLNPVSAAAPGVQPAVAVLVHHRGEPQPGEIVFIRHASQG